MWKIIILCIAFLVHIQNGYALATEQSESSFVPCQFSSDKENKSPEEIRASHRCFRNRYRTFDGSCNNYWNPEWGTPGKPYGRLFNNSYSDGKHAFPRSVSNEPLASPRTISRVIFPDEDIKDKIWTLLTLQWGQVVAHDLSLTYLENAATCCSQGQYTDKEYTDDRCASIRIPPDDPVFGPAGDKCFDFYRTESTDGRKKPNEPKSSVTAYMDLSVVYGSSSRTAKDLRSYSGGRLITETRHGQEWLPQSHEPESTCFNVTSKEPCYRAGDSRVNQNTMLSVLQNILMREHNRIADYLCSANSQWSDEKCFQEARRILIAIVQRINYYEFFPILIGWDHMVQNKLIFPNAEGYVNDYDYTVNPAVLNEFATAAYRNYHSSIVAYLRFYLENREPSSSGIRISDYMNKPGIIEEYDNFSQLGRGLATEFQEAVDRFYTVEMTQYMFKRGNKLGQDLRSLDIQRSRDHGVGTYETALLFCNLSKPTCFEDFKKFIPHRGVSLLKEVYENYKDVELIVGAALETLLPDTLVGPTFQCIMTEQFRRTRRGDRYFYENGNSAGTFTPEQLRSIREGSTIASLLCNNVDGIEQMQPQAFLKIYGRNQLVPCNTLPQVDLSLWNERYGG